MATYYTLKTKTVFRRDIPDNVVALLDKVVNHHDVEHISELFDGKSINMPCIYDKYFELEGWYTPLTMTNCEPGCEGGSFYMDKCGRWNLTLSTNFRYGGEKIQYLFEWLAPFIEGRKQKKYIGYFTWDDSPDRCYLWVNTLTKRIITK